jgi:hypothetical protein
MLSKNLTLEMAVDPHRLLTRVSVEDRASGVSIPIPSPEAENSYIAVQTFYEGNTTRVVLENEGLSELAGILEVMQATPPDLWVNYWEINEIIFDRLYAARYAHGTGDHMERMLIAKLIDYILELGGNIRYAGTKNAVNTDKSDPAPPPPAADENPPVSPG